MTLDEHIKKAEEDAVQSESDSDWGFGNYFIDRTEALEYAENCRQLAEWLKDYKRLLEQEPILDKIRAEVLEEKECAYADFERYKVEYMGQDLEDVYDSLPHDDFRYGMERCIEIIDKYKAERINKE